MLYLHINLKNRRNSIYLFHGLARDTMRFKVEERKDKLATCNIILKAKAGKREERREGKLNPVSKYQVVSG